MAVWIAWMDQMKAGVIMPMIRMQLELVIYPSVSCRTASVRGMARGFQEIWRGTMCPR